MALLKYALAAAGLSLLAFHLFATISHVAPENPYREAIKPITQPYIQPLLRQQWHMFAPDPATSCFKFLFRYQSVDGTWSEWLDAGEPRLRAHQRNRLGHHGHLYWVHEGIGHQLWNRAVGIDEAIPNNLDEKERTRQLNEQIVDTDEYRLARRYFLDLAGQHAALDTIRQVEFQGMVKPVRPFSQRHNPDAVPQPTIRNFPPVVLAN